MGQRQQPRVTSLLPVTARRTAVTVLACCAAVTAVGAYVCARGAYGDPIDGPIDSWIVGHMGGHGRELQLAADLGQPTQVVVMTTVLILACLAAGRINGAMLTAISVSAASVLTEKVLKPLVHESYSAYPSGRATGAFALIAILAVLLAHPSRSKSRSRWRIAVVAAAALVGCAVCVATVGLNDHHFTDTVGGAAVGTGVVLTVTLLLDLPVVRKLMAFAYPRQRRSAWQTRGRLEGSSRS